MAEPDGDDVLASDLAERLHPASILVQLFEALLKFGWTILVLLLVSRITGERNATPDLIIAGLGLLAVVGSVVSYFTTRFAISDGQVLMRAGLIHRTRRVIPFGKVQSTSIRRNILERRMGLATFVVDTASGGKSELTLTSIPLPRARALQAAIQRKDTSDAEMPEEQPGDIIWRSSLADLIVAGLTSGALTYALAACAVLAAGLQDRGGLTAMLAEHTLQRLTGGLGIRDGVWMIAMLLGIAAVASVIQQIARFHGFVLFRQDGHSLRRFGWVAMTERIVSQRRIQVVRVEQPLLRRLIGRAAVYEESAGEIAQGPQQQTPLCPLVPTSGTASIIAEAFPELRFDHPPWQRPKAMGRVLYTAGLLIFAVPMALFVAWATEISLVKTTAAVTTLCAAWGILAYFGHAYTLYDHHVAVRTGALNRITLITPRARIQTVLIKRSWVDRRFGLCTLLIDHAGARSPWPMEIIGMPYRTGVELQDVLSQDAHNAGPWTADGL